MSIRQMIPRGIHMRPCPVCGAIQTPQSDERGNAIPMTAHEEECINKALATALLKGDRK
jgi:hypothetical protein